MKAENIAQDSLEGSKRDSLIEAAMGGDEDAIETLTASDIEMCIRDRDNSISLAKNIQKGYPIKCILI